MNTIRTWHGVVAEIRWHTYTAAGIRGYTIARTQAGGLTVRATVLLSDAFKLAQRPLTFVMPVRLGKPPYQRDHEYRYPMETFTLRDGALEATLGPRIREPYAALPFRRPDPRSPIVLVR
jgi:hypothetical protein